MDKRNFEEWLDTMIDSIANFEYYIDFETIYKNAEIYKVELNVLNSLIGSKNIEKEFESIKYELEYFKKNYVELEENFIGFYFIGVKDRIIPALKLEKFCKEKNINYKNIECGHYPFSYFKDISNIVDGEKNEI